jgi:hypothetical protein
MINVLLEYLLVKPGLYQDEMADFLDDAFDIRVKPYDISGALKSAKWSKKVARQVAKERNPDLRDYYLHNLSEVRSYHLVYIDESGCDQRIGIRRTAWAPLGVTPVQTTALHRDRRYHILPAYAQNGVLSSRVFQGTTDGDLYEEFIEPASPPL